MFIKELQLKCFKSYCDVKLEFDKNFNVIIGENNIGKTTLFEALLLWKKCYDINITSNGKEFYSNGTALYINFEELHFIRLSKDNDIYWGSKNNCEISVVFAEEESDNEFSLGFKLTKPQNIPNAYIRVSKMKENEFTNLNIRLKELNIKLREFVFMQQTSPVSNVLSKEPFMYKGQILKKIEKGKSDEVLRNKVIQSLSKNNDLEVWMKKVLDTDFKFVLPKKADRDRAEYINLKVNNGNIDLDIYLQGSGFLQVAEIFSTIDVMDNALNILLIDEPDSHINPRVQNKLLSCLREIKHTQIFVISHNDNFVADVEPRNVIFVNEDNKGTGKIESLNEISIDSLHLSLGGVISGLTKLQKCKRVVFVEGKDDIEYIKMLSNALKRINTDCQIDTNSISFWHIRGKDYLLQKVMTGKQLLSQAVKQCKFSAVFDKDFSTNSANEKFLESVIGRLGTNAVVHVHDGYCIESVLFSNPATLSKYLKKLFDSSMFDIDEFICKYLEKESNEISSLDSDIYCCLKSKFTTQKKDSRPELENVDFDDFAKEASKHIQFYMNKDNIKAFILKLESQLSTRILERTDDDSETIASRMLEEYFKRVEEEEDLFADFKLLAHRLH